MSKRGLLEKLTDKAYRDAFISEEIDVGLPMQLRAMREERDWKQSYVAEKTGTKQPRITLMEKPGYGNFSLSTLKKLAALFDVGLIVSFVPWSEMIDFTQTISNKRLAISRFADEYLSMEKRYSRAGKSPINAQANFEFTTTPAGSVEHTIATTGSTASTEIGKDLLEHGYIEVSQLGGDARNVSRTAGINQSI